MAWRAIGCPPALAPIFAGESAGGADVLVAFVRDRAAAGGRIAEALALFAPGMRLWFAYPKQSGALAGDLSRDAGWEALAAADFLAVTQVAIDADWSALRFRPRGEIPRLTRASERGA